MDRVLTHDIPLLLQKVTIWRMFDCIFFHLRLLSYSIWCFLLTSLTSLCLSLFFSFSRSRALYFILSDSLSLSLYFAHSVSLFSLLSYFSLPLSRPPTLLWEGISNRNNNNSSNMRTPIPTILSTSHRNNNNSKSRKRLQEVTSGENCSSEIVREMDIAI